MNVGIRLTSRLVVGLPEDQIDFSIIPELKEDTCYSMDFLTELFNLEKYKKLELRVFGETMDVPVIGVSIQKTSNVTPMDDSFFFTRLVDAKKNFMALFKKLPQIILMADFE